MARVAITVQQISRTGLEETLEAAQTDGNSWNNTGKEILHIINGATDVLITVATPRGVDGQVTTSRVVTCSANEERFIGPFPPEDFNQRGALGDIVHCDYDSVANVTVAVIRI